MCSSTGPVDTALAAEPAEALITTLREALTNVARHTQATHAWVEVVATDGEVILRVVDDGVGPPPTSSAAGRGLPNLAARARRFGGSFSIGPGPHGGALAEWRIPASS